MGNHHWTDEEIKIITEGFHHIPDFILVDKLPGRSILAISQKRRNMGYKYTQEWLNEHIK